MGTSSMTQQFHTNSLSSATPTSISTVGYLPPIISHLQPTNLPLVFTAQYAQKQTYSIGQLLTILDIFVPAPNYTGPIDVILGQFDFAFCSGDCSTPTDEAAAVKPALYPAAGAGSQSYIVPSSGHCLNAHVEAPLAFAQMIAFLRANRL